jgi:hypothetical protein
MKNFFIKNWFHFAIIGLFFMITFIYFSPQFNGYGLKQHDVEQYIGMSHEAYYFGDKTGEEQLWTNSMFGGMPTTQISLIHSGNFIGRTVMNFVNNFSAPGGIVFLHLICFYFMLLCFKVDRRIAIIGAIAFSFSSYEIIILQAGHNSKAMAVAFMAPVIGTFFMAYRHNRWLGIGLSALAMAFELSCNHLQVTYYMAFLILALGLVELVRAFKTSRIKSFLVTTVWLVFAYVLALGVNYSNVNQTNEYASATIRGGNDLKLDVNGKHIDTKENNGLDKEYITNWSYGIDESFTLLSPDVKGGGTFPFEKSPYVELIDDMELDQRSQEMLLNSYSYWGTQPMTSGPVYVGVIMLFFCFLGIIFLKDNSKWALLGVGILALMLSWGKNYMPLTDFFIDNIPGYNKFRTVTIILVLIELIVPLIAVLFINKLFQERDELKMKNKQILVASFIFVLFLLIIQGIGLGDGYSNKEFDDRQMASITSNLTNQIQSASPAVLKENYGVDVNDKDQLNAFINLQLEPYENNAIHVKNLRKRIFNVSMNRSIILTLFGVLIIVLFLFTNVNMYILIFSIGILTMIDLFSVSTNYLSKNEKYWIDKLDKKYPIFSTQAEQTILDNELKHDPLLVSKIEEAKKAGESIAIDYDVTGSLKSKIIASEVFSALNANTNYRVFDFTGGFNSTRASYFHKSIGGYHGAKLRTFQNLIEHHIGQSNSAVLNMLNVKYFIREAENGLVAQENLEAMGAVWFVEQIKTVEDRDVEIKALGRLYAIDNIGKGVFLVNDSIKSTSLVNGNEKLIYVLNGDSLSIPLSANISKEFDVYFVKDVNGKTELVPEFVVKNDSLNSFQALVLIKLESEFVPKEIAFISKENALDIKDSKFDVAGDIYLDSYSPMNMVYKSISTTNQFAVFSEIYYRNGWQAFIDGQEVDIKNVNYCLRGLEIPKGKHEIVFKYNQSSFLNANKISFVFCLLVLTLLGFSIWKNKKQDTIEMV